MKQLFTLLLTLTVLSAIAQQDPWQQQTGDMPPARAFHTMVEINGTVYLFGGEDEASRDMLNDLWSYDESNTWSRKEPLNPPSARRYHTATAKDGKMYVFGGEVAEGISMDIWVYDPELNEWTKEQDNSTQNPKVNHRAIAGESKIWITGGYDFITGEATGATWSYDVNTLEWTRVADCPSPRLGHVTYYKDGKLVVYGGKHGDKILKDMWSYDIEKNEWTEITPVGTSPERLKFSAYDDNDEILWVAGGMTITEDGPKYSEDTWEYDIQNNSWKKKTNGPPFSFGAGAILPNSNRSNDYVALTFAGKLEGILSNETWIYNSADDLTAINEKPSYPLNVKVYTKSIDNYIAVESDEIIQEIKVFNSNGKLILMQQSNSYKTIINLQGRTSHFYILQIRSNNILITKKITI